MSQSSDSACPTRQQLDELEALMQRMLALPVSEGEEAPLPPLPPPPDIKARSAALPPRLRAIPDPPSWEEPPVTPPPAPRPPRVPAPQAPPSVVYSERVQVESCETPPAPAEAAPAVEPVVVAAPARPRIRVRTTPRPAEAQPAAWWLWPLIWSNHAFDRGTVRLGRPGRWLRGARGRAWIGWTGILLLALAVAWGVLEWLGLTW
jgi:hypothetical protein